MRSTALILSLACAAAAPARADKLMAGAAPEQRLSPTCLVYAGYVVVLIPDADSGGEAISIRPRRKAEILDAQQSCQVKDPTAVFRTKPSGNSQFAGLIGDVAFIADEEIRKSLFAYELPSGKELFVARHWEKPQVDAATKAISFEVPAQSDDCETSYRAATVQEAACRKRADESVKCLRGSAERYQKTPAKVDLLFGKAGKDCRFDVLERFRFDPVKKKLEPTGEVSVRVTNTL